MKISKRQLREIIKKEKSKLINESRMGERALGMYAKTADIAALKDQIVAFLEDVWAAAEADGLEIEEASELAEMAFADLAADALGTMGMMRLRHVLSNVGP